MLCVPLFAFVALAMPTMVPGKEDIATIPPPFVCVDGTKIALSQVCDGIPNCPDSSDELRKLCHHILKIPEQLKCNRQANCYMRDEDENECGFSSSSGDCRLPATQPGRHYTVSECPYCCPGSLVHKFTRLNFTCDEENSLHGPKTAYCYNGKWLPSLPDCSTGNGTITCPSIKAPGAEKRCEAKSGPHQGWISCDKSAPVGTLVTLECPEFYERHSGAFQTTCLHDGTWSRIPLSCVPICGVRENSVGPLIVKGWEVPSTDPLPWHATLFSHNDGNWTFFCGGTLIAERLILTAAHCVWKTDPDTIKVGLAYYSNKITDKDENTQIIDVERIEQQTSYQDHEGNYNSDVALLILKTQVTINSFVLPACIDWTNSADISSRTGEIGLTSGMGLTENDTYSQSLRATSMKLISEEKCRESHARDFRKYLTYTSFCAGWENGTSVCNGDSGGGLVLLKPNTILWEIQGIVSVSPRRLGSTFCDPNYYTIFTKVSVYSNWIRKILEKIPILGPRRQRKVPNSDTLEK